MDTAHIAQLALWLALGGMIIVIIVTSSKGGAN
jgi:hypothetical protein